MAKKCADCNLIFEKGTFCPKCGLPLVDYYADTAPVSPDTDRTYQYNYQEPVYSEHTYTAPVQYAPPQVPGAENADSAPAPKSEKKSILIIVLIIAGVLLIAGAAVFAVKTFVIGNESGSQSQKKDKERGSASDSRDEDEDDAGGFYEQGEDGQDNDLTPYTKGEIIDGSYINEWANIKYRITDDLPEGPKSLYSSYENQNTDCGFLASDGERQLAIVFEKLGSASADLTAGDYLDLLEKRIVSEYGGLGIDVSNQHRIKMKIAGENYDATVLNIKFSVNKNTVCQYICVRKIDNYMSCVIATDTEENRIVTVLDSIKSAK